jgi:hypothetical protein
MNSGYSDGMQDQFSSRPMLHYFLAISLTSIVVAFVLSFRTYNCLHSGNTYNCSYDPGSPAVVGSGASDPNIFSILRATLLISSLSCLASVVIFLVANIPIYSLAWYVSGRYRIRRNILGIAFWIATWILSFLTLPILSGIQSLFDVGHVSWFADLLVLLEFSIAGIFCGIAYCALAFLHSDQT